MSHSDTIKKAWYIFDLFFDLDLSEPVDLMSDVLRSLLQDDEVKNLDVRAKAETLLKEYNLFKAIETRETLPTIEQLDTVKRVAASQFFGKYQHVLDGYLSIAEIDD